MYYYYYYWGFRENLIGKYWFSYMNWSEIVYLILANNCHIAVFQEFLKNDPRSSFYPQKYSIIFECTTFKITQKIEFKPKVHENQFWN